MIINVDLDRGKTSCAWWRAMRSRFTRTRRAPKAARANHKSRSVSIYEYQKILKNRLIKSCSFKTPKEFPEILPVFFESFINFQTFCTTITFEIYSNLNFNVCIFNLFMFFFYQISFEKIFYFYEQLK